LKLGFKKKSAFHELKALNEGSEEELRKKSYPYLKYGKPSEEMIAESMKSYAKYRKQWKVCGDEYEPTSFPVNVDIETSSFCNLRCKMCNWGFDPGDDPGSESFDRFQSFKNSCGNMDIHLYRNIVNEVAKERGYAVKLNWRGEPLMNKKIVQMIRFAKDQGVIEVLMNTNGVLLNPRLSKDIVEAGLDMIVFSFDGITKKTYESIRKGSNFVAALSNLLYFIKIRDEHKEATGSPKPLIRVQMVVMDENKHEIDSFYNFFSPIVDLISTQDYTSRGEKNIRLTEDTLPMGRKTCPQIWQRIIVTWDGNVGMCCRDWDLYHPIGKLNYPDNTIKSIWSGNELKEIRETHLEESLESLKACKTCTYKESYKWK